MAQSNSEHSRHWFFGAHLVINGEQMPESLMQIVKATLKANPGNSVIGFKDNSSAIRWDLQQPQVDSTPDCSKRCSLQMVRSRLPSTKASLSFEIYIMLCCTVLTALTASLCAAPACAYAMSRSALCRKCFSRAAAKDAMMLDLQPT